MSTMGVQSPNTLATLRMAVNAMGVQRVIQRHEVSLGQ